MPDKAASAAGKEEGRCAYPPEPVAAISPEGNDVGVDPHKQTLRHVGPRPEGRGARHGELQGLRRGAPGHGGLGGRLRSGAPLGHRGASSLGRHTAMYLVRSGHDVREVCPNGTNGRERGRQRGKSDAIDSVKVAREVQADPDLPVAFERAGAEVAPRR